LKALEDKGLVMQNRITGKNETNETKSKAKVFWKKLGFFVLALFVAIITVLVLNLNRQ